MTPIAVVGERERERGFMPQLDGLRAFAVGAVLVHHLLDPALLPAVPFLPTPGLLGVRLFFVLSGFLITGLLVRARDAIDCGSQSRGGVLRQFYLRRTLRIFPLYYLVLLVALLFGDADTRAQLPWLATYTYNFRVASQGWFPGCFAHFWSLCVEEQFYLVWPWIIVFAPRRRWTAIAVAMIAVAPLYRAVAFALDVNIVAFYALTPSSFDALGVGALLAVVTRGQPASGALERRLRWSALPLGIAGLVLIAGSVALTAALGELLVAFVFVWLIAGASRGFGGVGRAVLEARPILYLGKISYGIYVYHLLVPEFAGPLLDALSLRMPYKSPSAFFVYATLTVVIASASWWCFERPINALKRRFGDSRVVVSRALVG
jgi:peptidoglycan/LPS O-acetylase OafA/YrhL